MARLESQSKMGHYPTPHETLEFIKKWIHSYPDENISILDPCCGTGKAINSLSDKIRYMLNSKLKTYGIELDRYRYENTRGILSKSICASIYDMNIRPLESFSVLYLNPPYDWDHGERMEFSFLKHSHKWLKAGGLLIFLIPESILAYDKMRKWIARRYENIRVFRFTKEDYPTFKQVVVFGVKQNEESEDETFPLLPYPHIEDSIFTSDFTSYVLIEGSEIDTFETKNISEEEISAYKETAIKNVKESLGIKADKCDKKS